MSSTQRTPAIVVQMDGKITISATATVAALATCPEGNDPKSLTTMMSSGRARPNVCLRTCTTAAEPADAATKYTAAQGLRRIRSTIATTMGTTNTPNHPPPRKFMTSEKVVMKFDLHEASS